ncbi:hypothetical protein [Tengunoibacter tsumagoiensis]|uniref:Uncharacterized protein n=1 Tax=Tengunoibacter tsumagoiensis TaxID=2014871 RepID=A0A402A7D7_9CHLR|nr:hypothetical protein [Tengunoibacter tsumagoiensis]GCE15074.1 hypothetical protein KTT_49330 [Tengunoibacter tsumagoiensis]
MSLVDDLESLRQHLGRSIVLPTPPACQALFEQAKAEGIPVGNLFILSRSLAAGVRGSYERRSGDVWCHYDSRSDEGALDVLQCLLTLIAYVKLSLPPPMTIEEDWHQFRLAHEETWALAKAWKREELFTALDLEAFLAHNSYLYRCHAAAGDLAGNLRPSSARNAYLALLDVQRHYQWSDTQFEAALEGRREDDEEANTVVLDFDRCSLRAFWFPPERDKRDQASCPFGQFTLPQTTQTARVLRSVLALVASQSIEARLPKSADGPSPTFFYLECEQDLSIVMAHINALFLEDFPDYSLRAQFSLYADVRWKDTVAPSPHLYNVRMEYLTCDGKQECTLILRELWMLVPARKRNEIIEAAWQRYLRSWLTCASVSTYDLYTGLQSLWPFLQSSMLPSK